MLSENTQKTDVWHWRIFHFHTREGVTTETDTSWMRVLSTVDDDAAHEKMDALIEARDVAQDFCLT